MSWVWIEDVAKFLKCLFKSTGISSHWNYHITELLVIFHSTFVMVVSKFILLSKLISQFFKADSFGKVQGFDYVENCEKNRKKSNSTTCPL